MVKKKENFYKGWYEKSSNKELLKDYHGMKQGKYYTDGLSHAKREIARRKKVGLMRKEAGHHGQRTGIFNFSSKPFGMRF